MTNQVVPRYHISEIGTLKIGAFTSLGRTCRHVRQVVCIIFMNGANEVRHATFDVRRRVVYICE